MGRVTTYEAPLEPGLRTRGSAPASREALIGLFEHLERELEAHGFFTAPEKRPSMVQNMRSMFVRMGATEQEIRTLRGIVKALVQARRSRAQFALVMPRFTSSDARMPGRVGLPGCVTQDPQLGLGRAGRQGHAA